jgi:hypothetical protein
LLRNSYIMQRLAFVPVAVLLVMIGIASCMAFYNTSRPHQALRNQSPMAVWRAEVTGEIGETAVDMALRLDNAAALPTYPQPQQQLSAA